ncbi:hypothetical protein HGA91_02045 [candidate division WWE3 bacterium]|nr:hypothetical protein [candidate division WWE3 bacterium]
MSELRLDAADQAKIVDFLGWVFPGEDRRVWVECHHHGVYRWSPERGIHEYYPYSNMVSDHGGLAQATDYRNSKPETNFFWREYNTYRQMKAAEIIRVARPGGNFRIDEYSRELAILRPSVIILKPYRASYRVVGLPPEIDQCHILCGNPQIADLLGLIIPQTTQVNFENGITILLSGLTIDQVIERLGVLFTQRSVDDTETYWAEAMIAGQPA